MNYTLNQLRIYQKIVELRSITKAANALHLTQPAVSIQLKKFQDQFSIPLTEVVGRQLYVTSFGEEINLAVKKILDEVRAIDYKTSAYEGKLAGKLSFSVVSTGKYVMPYFLSRFINTNKGIDLVMDVTNKSIVVNSLENNEVDFALVSVIPKHLDLESLPLMDNKLFLVGNAETENNRTCEVTEIFNTYPALYRESGSATRNAMEDFLETRHYSSTKKIELTSNEALKQSIIAGLGYSIMPLIGIKNAVKDGELVLIPHKGLPIITTWNLVWLRAKNLSPAALAFLDYIRTEKDSIIKEYFSWISEYR